MRESETMPVYDIIGDIHGSATQLHGLLDVLGWVVDDQGVHRHPDAARQAIFVGDLIDRGGEQLATLETVSAMVEAGSARIVMGNHEFNAISYATEHPDRNGEHLRPRSDKNRRQHVQFLEQIDESERPRWIDWFRTLPIWLDLGDLRIVHACWHQPSVDLLKEQFGSNHFPGGDVGFVRANRRGDAVWEAIEVLLKGPEIELAAYGLPDYSDKDGNPRAAARARWWNAEATTLNLLIDIPDGTMTTDDLEYPPIPEVACQPRDRQLVYQDPIPVVYGHHWRQWEPDEHLDWTQRTACVDFSAVKGGPLVAYQWRGEPAIDPSHYVAYPNRLPAHSRPTG